MSELKNGGMYGPLANIGFELPESKSRILRKSRDVLVVVSMIRRYFRCSSDFAIYFWAIRLSPNLINIEFS